MKMRSLIVGAMAMLALGGLSVRAADGNTQFTARSGSKMRIDGTANMIHTKWGVQSEMIAGKFEVGPGFPIQPGQTATPGPVKATADVFIPISSLKSIEPDGSHYSDAMDNVMYDHLKMNVQSKIFFHLTDLVLKETAKDKDAPYVFEAKGELAVAGVTNKITMPVQVLPLAKKNIAADDAELKVSGAVAVKMTDFKIDPPAPKPLPLVTGDEVKLSFDWMVGHRMVAAAAAK